MPTITAKPSEASQALAVNIAAGQPTFLWGAPGIGKSQVVQQTAAGLGLACQDVRAVLLDPVDLRGLPTVVDGRSRWAWRTRCCIARCCTRIGWARATCARSTARPTSRSTLCCGRRGSSSGTALSATRGTTGCPPSRSTRSSTARRATRARRGARKALHVLYCDAAVQGEQEFVPDDPAVQLAARGGGGTRFQPALDWFSAGDQHPAAVVYLTDLENGAESMVEPAYPVLWVVPEGSRRTAGPFGRSVVLGRD